MQIIFVRTNALPSLAISLATLSAWSHCALIDGDTIMDATWKHGVSRRSLQSFLGAYPQHVIVDVPVPHPEASMAFAEAQLGKPYDGSAYLWWAMPWRDWQDPGAWECSEYLTALLQAGGWRPELVPGHVSPGRLRAYTRPIT